MSAADLTRADFDRLENKIDQLLELAPTIEALGSVLIRQKVATERAGLSKNTLSQNDSIAKYEEVGHRRTFIEVGDLAMIRKRPRRKSSRGRYTR